MDQNVDISGADTLSSLGALDVSAPTNFDLISAEIIASLGIVTVAASADVPLAGVATSVSMPTRLRTCTTNSSPEQDITFLRVGPSQTGLLS